MNVILKAKLQKSGMRSRDVEDILTIYWALNVDKQKNVIKNVSFIESAIKKLNEELKVKQELLLNKIIENIERKIENAKRRGLQSYVNDEIFNLRSTI